MGTRGGADRHAPARDPIRVVRIRRRPCRSRHPIARRRSRKRDCSGGDDGSWPRAEARWSRRVRRRVGRQQVQTFGAARGGEASRDVPNSCQGHFRVRWEPASARPFTNRHRTSPALRVPATRGGRSRRPWPIHHSDAGRAVAPDVVRGVPRQRTQRDRVSSGRGGDGPRSNAAVRVRCRTERRRALFAGELDQAVHRCAHVATRGGGASRSATPWALGWGMP